MSEIKIKVVIDGQESIQTIDELNKSLDSFKQNTEGLDNGSEEVDNFNKSLEELQKTLDDGLKLDLDVDELNKRLTDVSADLTQITGQSFEIKVDVPENAATSIKGIRAELKAAKDELASAEFGSPEFEAAALRAGELSEQIKDVNEAINAQSGEPIERVAKQFAGLGESILTLDFGKATAQLGTLNKTISSFDFGKIAKDAGEFGKVLGGSLKNGVVSLGRALLANPIFLIGAVITGVVVAIVELKDKFEIIQVAIDAATKQLKILIQTFKDLSDALGLSNFEEQETLENTAKAYDKKVQEIDKATQKELKLAQARGDSAEELLAIEEKAAQDRAKIAQDQLNTNQSYLNSLQNKVDKNRELTDKEKEDYEKLKKSVEDLSNAQFDLQLITLKRAELAAKTAEKEAEVAEKNIEKSRQEYAKYLTELQNLRNKFLLTEEQQIAKRYDDELKKIKGNSELERQLREAIIKERQKALEDFTNQEVQKNLELQEKIKENELKLQTNKALEAAKTSDEILRIETALANNINALEIERIERVRNEQIRLAEGNAELIKKANQEADIAIQESEKRREQSIKDSNDKTLAERKKQLEDETKIVIDETNKQLTEIQNKRQNILNESGGGFGILGTLDNLKSNFDEERRLVTEQVNKLKDLNQEIIDSENTSDAEKEAARQRNIQLEEDYQKTLTQINADESQLRQQIIQDEINNRTQQIGQALAVVETLSSVQLDNERSRLDQSRAIQDAEFERRREQIEESITDERINGGFFKRKRNYSG